VIKPLRLTVLTPAETLIEAKEVKWVQAQLADGSGISIWPGHAPLLGKTITASLRYADEAGEHACNLEAGILQVGRDGVTIFTSGLAPPPGSEPAGDSARLERLAEALFAPSSSQPGLSDENELWP